MTKRVILGATSAIAMATAREFAAQGESLVVVARDEEKLEALRNDLLTRGAKEVYMIAADLAEEGRHDLLLDQFEKVLPGYTSVLIAYGTLGNQEDCEKDFQKALQELQVNFISPASFVSGFANVFLTRERPSECSIAVITSVAGDRGRKSNYVYGSAKGGLSLFLQGVRNRLSSAGIQVLSIKPGFVDTPMTADIEKGPLFASPEVIGRGICRAIERKKNVVYLPWFWWGIMSIICAIPERFFKRMSI